MFSAKVIEVIKNDYLLDYQQKSKVIYVSLKPFESIQTEYTSLPLNYWVKNFETTLLWDKSFITMDCNKTLKKTMVYS